MLASQCVFCNLVIPKVLDFVMSDFTWIILKYTKLRILNCPGSNCQKRITTTTKKLPPPSPIRELELFWYFIYTMKPLKRFIFLFLLTLFLILDTLINIHFEFLRQLRIIQVKCSWLNDVHCSLLIHKSKLRK